ncbi:MAG: DNA polymerase/3'-5' exonuclease PolX [Gemmatimonadaceae bacterium]
MDPRAAAVILAEIATLLELRGEAAERARTLRALARALNSMQDTADVSTMLQSVTARDGIDEHIATVLRELHETGDSDTLHLLRETTPEGLLDMLRVPGLGTRRIHDIHQGLGIETLQDLERAVRDGRLAALPRFGAKAAERILRGIAYLRESGEPTLYPHALVEAQRLMEAVRSIPGVTRVDLAGSLRRRCELIGDIDLVITTATPGLVSAALPELRGVTDAVGAGSNAVTLHFDDGTRADMYCATPSSFALTLWLATGSAEHCAEAIRSSPQLELVGDRLHDPAGRALDLQSEQALYSALGLSYIEPELREGRGEVANARERALPSLVGLSDIRGVLHCHSAYSDGTTGIEELAVAAQQRGWEYIGITDHSQGSFYAGGLSSESVYRQHAEIDRVNASLTGVRVLKGIEADILPDGSIDYDERLLERFDYVIASVHSRFGMDEARMTDRVLRAMDDPHVTILGHPTGRLLLTREPYALDVQAVVERAAEAGVAVELNADPHRLDLDWRWLRQARGAGAMVEIGPDAHTIEGLDNMEIGVGIARKGWLAAPDVLNTRSAHDVLAFAKARRTGPPATDARAAR